jgi:hypothetical protein
MFFFLTLMLIDLKPNYYLCHILLFFKVYLEIVHLF